MVLFKVTDYTTVNCNIKWTSIHRFVRSTEVLFAKYRFALLKIRKRKVLIFSRSCPLITEKVSA